MSDATRAQGAGPNGLMRAWERSSGIDPRYLVAFLITLVLVAAQFRYNMVGGYTRLALALFVCTVTEALLSWFERGKIVNLQSAYISGLSLTLLLKPQGGALWPFVIGGFLAIASKYVLRYRESHLWNPTNFAICALLLVAPHRISVLSHQFGNDMVTNVVVWFFGLVIAARVGVLHITLTYVASFLLLNGIRAAMLGQPLMPEIAPITGPMYQLFIFFMITDPRTVVRGRGRQAFVAAVIAVTETMIRLASDQAWPLPTAFSAAPALLALGTVGPLAKWIDSGLVMTKPRPRHGIMIAFLPLLFNAAASVVPRSGARAQGPPDQNRFTREILVERLDEPMQLEFDRAGRVYVIERKGVVKRFDEATGRVTALGKIPVAVLGESGLVGLLLDRDFDRTRQLYVSFLPFRDSSEMRLSRFTLDARDGIDLSSEVVLMRWPFDLASHVGGGMTWDAAGNLYLTTGDNTEATQYSPVHWTKVGGKGQDAQRTSANSNDLRGKILRIHPESDGTYTIPGGNLFPPGTPNARPEIYTMGNRNPWRVTVDSKTGFLHWGEIGPDAGRDSVGVGPMGYDELNVAASAGNYGWPFFIGYNRGYHTVEDGPPKTFGPPMDPARPVNRSPNNSGIRELPPARVPLLSYPYGVSEEFPMLGSGGRCAVGGPIFYASNFTGARRFPDYYEGKWFVVDYMRMWIMVATMNDDRTKVVSMERFLPDEKVTAPLDMDFGPNGDLYVIEYAKAPDGRLSKVEYNAGNRAPRVVASADRLAGATPLRVSLSSRGTVDYDGDALRYRWTLTPDGGTARRYTSANPVITLSAPGVYIAMLTVTDSSGASSRDSVRLVAGNEPPRVALNVTRGNRSFYFPDGRVDYNVRATDREDGQPARGRMIVTADYIPSGMTPNELAWARDVSPDASMRHVRAHAIIARSDCMACHRLDTRFIGPGWTEVARRYAGQDALEKIAQKIITGGKGVWGEATMPPHHSLTSSDASTLAQYVLSLSNTNARPARLPLAGRYTTTERRVPTTWDPKKTMTERGSYVLRATYTDNGAKGVAPLTTSAAVLLRYPLLAPETADSISSGITYNLSKGDPGFVIRRSGSHLAFRGIDLTGIGSIHVGGLTRFYTWSHFKGATVAVHLDSATGRLAGPPVTIIPPPAKADPVVLGDNLEKPVSITLESTSGVHDVYVVFTNADARSDDDLLLLTGVEFKPAVRIGDIPNGFTRLFNGRDLTGWHVSRTSHQGTTPDIRVEDSAIVLRQQPYGQGGLLMTDRRFRNFELYLEAKPDSGTNGGIFLRSSEGGSAYQVEVEGDGAGGTGSLFGEMQRVSTPVRATGVQGVWRPNDWNALRIRVESDVPRMALSINGVRIYDAHLGRNDLIGGRTDGMIALQVHWSATHERVAGAFDMSGSWKPGAAHRYRNVAIRVLPP